MSRPALFLDRDGVINRRIVGDYVRTPNNFVLLPDVLPLLQQARDTGMLLVLITNQQGVGKGLMTQQALDVVHHHMQQLLRQELGFALDAIYVCTDLASANSPRRKPAPGMLLEAMQDLAIDAATSWFVGDSLTDALAGKAAGVRTILVGNHPADAADVVVPTLSAIRPQQLRP